MRALSHRLAKNRAKQVNRITGRHVLFAQTLVKMNLANRTRAPHQQPLSRHKVMKIHGQEWARLGDDVKAQLNTVASQWRASREQELRDSVESDREALQLARDRHKLECDEDLSMQLSSARMDGHALQGWSRILDSEIWTPSTITTMRSKSCKPPEPITVDRFEALAASSPLSIAHSEPLVPIAAALCRARSQLKNAVLIVEGDHGEDSFMIVTAMLAPMALFMLPLHEIVMPPRQHEAGTIADWDRMASTDFSHYWGYENDGYVSAEILEGVRMEQLAIVPCCLHKSTRIVTSMDSVVPLESWLSSQDAPTRKLPTESARAPATSAPKRGTHGDNPDWVAHLFGQTPASSHAISTASSSTPEHMQTVDAHEDNETPCRYSPPCRI